MRKWIRFPAPVLLAKEGRVSYPVSYEYNGGILIDEKQYAGYKVKPPVIPEGYILKSIGLGLNLNSKPPIATAYLQKKENK